MVLKKCDNNKSPGLDGLPYEFYKATWEIIGQDFFKVLKCQLDRVKLVESDKHGATRLTSKVDGIPAVFRCVSISRIRHVTHSVTRSLTQSGRWMYGTLQRN